MTDAPQIRLYDSMTRTKVPVRAPTPGRPLTMYVCGPTVYGRAHIGNARPAVVFDVLYRLLRHVHGPDNVRYARNITDIDDKIMAKAVAENRSPQAVAAEYEAHYHADMAALGCLPPDFSPRATDHIAGDHGMVAMIAALVDRGHAYVADGHVLFDVGCFDGYGALSRRPMDEMIAGARVEVAPYKRAPGDFVLWKPSTPDQPGWDTPWGRGRPGWHIECSAMIRAVLGEETIDIHGGGQDLQFPHHENERAQSCCAHGGAELSRIWMHNGFLTMGETKMSKSLGNIVTPAELIEQGWDGEVIRLALLSAHYRQPLKWTDALLTEKSGELTKIRRAGTCLSQGGKHTISSMNIQPMLDDINTPAIITRLHSLAEVTGYGRKHFQRVVQLEKKIDLEKMSLAAPIEIGALGNVLGFTLDGTEWRQRLVGSLPILVTDSDVEAQKYARGLAKTARDFAEADRIREELKAQGILLEDHKDGTTTWRRA